MDVTPLLLPVLNQLLIALLILGVSALLVIAHRRKLLSLLVDRQSALIDKLRRQAERGGVPNEKGLAHLLATAKWIQSRYRQEFAYEQQLPQRVSDPRELRQIEMAAALQILGQEAHAIRDGLDAEASWGEMRDALHKLLEPVCRTAEDAASPALTEEVAPDQEPKDRALLARLAELEDQVAELQEALRKEREKRAQLERELAEVQAPYQRLRDELARYLGPLPDGSKLGDWLVQRLDGLGVKYQPAVMTSGSEAGELSRKALADSLQKSEAEMKNLRNVLAGQHELVAKLKYQMTQHKGKGEGAAGGAQVPAEWQALERMLKESEACIKTLEMDLDQTHNYAHNLETEVAALKTRLAERPAAPAPAPPPKELPRETKELTDTIKVLEDAEEDHLQEIESLRKALEQEKNLNFVLRDQLGMDERAEAEDEPADDSAATPEADQSEAANHSEPEPPAS